MPNPHYLLAAVLVASAITWALRAVPFALLAPLRHSELIRFLGDHNPVGVMIALVGYTVRDIVWLDPAIALPILVSGAITAPPLLGASGARCHPGSSGPLIAQGWRVARDLGFLHPLDHVRRQSCPEAGVSRSQWIARHRA